MATLATVTQIRFPFILCNDGTYVQLRMNRYGIDAYTMADNDTLLLTDEGCPPFVGDIDLNQQYVTSEGFPSNDELRFELYDVDIAKGELLDGTPFYENLASARSTFLNTWFDDKENPYWVYATRYDSSFVAIDVPFCGRYKAWRKSQRQVNIRQPHTDFEVIHGQTRTIICIGASEIFSDKTWQDALNIIDESDCLQGTFYNGFMHGGYRTDAIGVRGGIFNNRAFVTDWVMQACPFIEDWFNLDVQSNGSYYLFQDVNAYVGGGWPVTPWDDPRTDGVHNTWGPNGTWGIKIGTVIEKIATAAGVSHDSSVDLQTAFKLFRQYEDSTNECFPVDSAGPMYIQDKYISLNYIAGAHPFYGDYWPHPAAFKPDDKLDFVLQEFCNFFFSRYDIECDTLGVKTLKIRKLNADNGALPTAWELLRDFGEEDPGQLSAKMRVNNRGDTLVIEAELNAKGDAATRETPVRLRRIGATVAQTSEALILDKAALLWSGDDESVQADKFFKVAFISVNGADQITLNPDCWVSMSGVYEYLSGNTYMYPSMWVAFPGNRNGNTFANAFYCLGVEYESSIAPGATPDNGYFDSRNLQAVAGSKYIIYEKTLLHRSYKGVAANDGTWTGVLLGLTDSWYYDNEIRTFRAIELSRGFRKGNANFKWQEIPSTGFPLLSDVAYGPEKGSTSGTVSSPTQSGATGGGPRDQTTNSVGALMEHPDADVINTITPPLTSTAFLIGRQNDGSGTELWRIDKDGNYIDHKVTKSAVSGTNNNYAIGATARFYELPASGAAIITGISGGVANREIYIRVTGTLGTDQITFTDEGAGSLAPNRFRFPGVTNKNQIVGPRGVLHLRYDQQEASGVGRWILIGRI